MDPETLAPYSTMTLHLCPVTVTCRIHGGHYHCSRTVPFALYMTSRSGAAAGSSLVVLLMLGLGRGWLSNAAAAFQQLNRVELLESCGAALLSQPLDSSIPFRWQIARDLMPMSLDPLALRFFLWQTSEQQRREGANFWAGFSPSGGYENLFCDSQVIQVWEIFEIYRWGFLAPCGAITLLDRPVCWRPSVNQGLRNRLLTPS